MPSKLEAFFSDDAYDAAEREALGDTIIYTPAGGVAAEILVYLDYSDGISGGSVGVATQDMVITAHRSVIPVKPGDGCRVTIPARGSEIYEPKNVRLDEDGRSWVFDLKKVPV